MSPPVMIAVWKARLPRHLLKRPELKLVLGAMANICQNREGTGIFASVATLADLCEMSERSIQRVLPLLLEAGLITVEQQATQHRPTTYRIELERLAGAPSLSSLDASTATPSLSPLPESQGCQNGHSGVTEQVARGDRSAMQARQACHPNQRETLRTRNEPRARESFESFWKSYPLKSKRIAALREWHRLDPDTELTTRIIASLAAQKTSPRWTEDNGRFIPHADSWLRDERWNDEAPAAPIDSAELTRRQNRETYAHLLREAR